MPWSEIELRDEPTEPQSEAAEKVNGWDVAELADHPDRPDPEAIHLPDDRRSHILDGNPNHHGGGHRHGTERAGKTEFPQRWDDDTACAYISEIARQPDTVPHQQDNRRWVCTGTRDGVEVVVIVWPEGKIWSAWPEPGGDGVILNPPKET